MGKWYTHTEFLPPCKIIHGSFYESEEVLTDNGEGSFLVCRYIVLFEPTEKGDELIKEGFFVGPDEIDVKYWQFIKPPEKHLTEEQIHNFNESQKNPLFHGLTCMGYSGCERPEENNFGFLVASKDGICCPCGKYSQMYPDTLAPTIEETKEKYPDLYQWLKKNDEIDKKDE